MRILQVNKFYYPRGGADKYFLNLTKALEADGQEVAVFSMEHPKNLPTPWSRYFVSRISFNEGGLKDRLKAPGRTLYSLEAKRKFARLVKDFRPDIIHIHNIYHQLSPSILDVAGKYHIPVVMHLHDYKLICPNYNLFIPGTQRESCEPHKYYQCLFNKSVKDSWAATALAVAEMYLHHSILKIYERNVSLCIAPSRFMKDTVVRFGWPENKVRVIYNPYSPEITSLENKAEAVNNKDYLLYFGRLSLEKGIETLIRATNETKQKLKIAGAGPEEESLKKLAADLQAPVEFLGFQEAANLKPIISNAKAVVIPSIWPENMPLSLLEAMSLGKVAIVSNIGGLPEIIKDGQNGFLFKPGSIEDLIRQINNLDKVDCQALGREAIKTVQDLSPSKNLEDMLSVYRELINK